MEQDTEQQISGQQSKSPRMHLQQGLLEIYCGRRKRKDDSGAGACTTGGRLRSTRAYCAVFKGNRNGGACVSCANSADQPGALRQELGIYLFHDGAGQKGDHRVSQPDAAGGDFHGKKRRNRRADFR